jgi:uncharacterized protein DUF6644
MSLFLPLFTWADHTAIGVAIRASRWLFPVIEAFHLVALALLGGTVLIVDMRLLGWGLRSRPVSELASDMQPWMVAGLLVMLSSGFLLFLSEPKKLYDNLPFQIKMVFLLLAIVYTFTIRRRLLRSNVDLAWPARSRLAGGVSIALWSVVGFMGRGIGFW